MINDVNTRLYGGYVDLNPILVSCFLFATGADPHARVFLLVIHFDYCKEGFLRYRYFSDRLHPLLSFGLLL